MSRDDAWILDIVHAARLAIEFLGDLDQAAFMEDLKTQAAVTRELEIIGEAAKRLSEEFRSENPDLPLREAAGMRDHIIHQYTSVDVRRVWQVVTRDLPGPISRLEPHLPEEPR